MMIQCNHLLMQGMTRVEHLRLASGPCRPPELLGWLKVDRKAASRGAGMASRGVITLPQRHLCVCVGQNITTGAH